MDQEVTKTVFWALGLVGFLLASYGGLREAFRILTRPRPYGEAGTERDRMAERLDRSGPR